MKEYYEEFHGFGRRKNKANSKPNKLVLSEVEWSQFQTRQRFVAEGSRLPQSLRSFAMTLVGYLKKQSQY